MKRSKQKNHWRLLCQQLRYAQRGLATSFVQMVKALPSRPEPRSVWDNVASPGRATVKGFEATVAAWAAMNAAIGTGSRAIIEETAQHVDAFFNEMKFVALAPYYANVCRDASLREKMVRASKEMTESLHALYSEDDIRRKIKELDESVAAELDLRAALVAMLAPAAPAASRRLAA